MKENNARTMPYSLEAEQSLLGCVLIDNEIAADVIGVLGDEDFYIESHKLILNAFKTVNRERKAIDIVTVADKLDSAGELGAAGNIAYLTELAQVTPSAANYKYYLEIVKRDSTNRKLIRAAKEIIEHAKKSDDEAGSIQFAESKIYGISERNDSSAIKSISEVLPGVLEEYQLRTENKSVFQGLMTGINRLDRLTNGLQKSNLIVLAARPGVGKTALAMNIVEHAAVNYGKVCAVFSLEMSAEELAKRILASASEVSQSTAIAGEMNLNEWKRVISAQQRLADAKIDIDDSSLVTPAEILSKCRRIKSKRGQLDLVMIDYIQLMHSGGKEENRVQEVAAITRELKIIAKELQVPVLALSQLKRLDKNDKPSLSDLRESGAIEQDADIVMFIERPGMNATEEEINKNAVEKDAAYLNVKKNRHGGLENIKLRFRSEITKFVNPEPDAAMESRLSKV